jgi:hypothetical protein
MVFSLYRSQGGIKKITPAAFRRVDGFLWPVPVAAKTVCKYNCLPPLDRAGAGNLSTAPFRGFQMKASAGESVPTSSVPEQSE